MSHLNIKTLLNVKEKNDKHRIEVDVVARKGSRGQCSQCGVDGPTYDHLPQREFLYVPLWGITVYLLYGMRRINCTNCNSLKAESVPWSDGKSPITISMMWYLSELAKILSWAAAAKLTKTTWHHIYTSVVHTVAWGRERVNLDGITAIGIDEIFWGKGKCATVMNVPQN